MSLLHMYRAFPNLTGLFFTCTELFTPHRSLLHMYRAIHTSQVSSSHVVSVHMRKRDVLFPKFSTRYHLFLYHKIPAPKPRSLAAPSHLPP
ncbi:hypothetical protein FKM82_022636 [Ascaphus truei]